jgi:His/Glu/Gln/Arg/opine family amino acid ABC transporter permease subunit
LQYYFNFRPIWESADKILYALLLGLEMAAVALAFGTVIGLFTAYARLSRVAVLRGLSWGYVEFIRNSPLLLLVFFVYFGLPEIGISFLEKIESFVLTLSIYAGAYLAEVFRAGLSSIPAQYVEAAKAIGLRPWQRQVYVVLPVMLRISLPALGNNLISLFKDTSLATAIAIPELTFLARQIQANYFRALEAWLTASVLYLATTYLIAFLLRLAERRYSSIR